MCGIVGYIGAREAAPLLVDGLKRLEYRGYDSAGGAFVVERRVVTEKGRGRVSEIASALVRAGRGATAGIAHTRWATHGRPSERNAHPHTDCRGRVAVVHNGIIENYRPLRDQLTAAGHRLVSETDTEILAHLVEDELNGDGLAGAVRRALQRVSGTFAVAVLSVDDPERLCVARDGSPLIVGVGSNEQFVGSDIPALLPFTRDQIVLEDGELALLSRSHVEVSALRSGRRLRRQPVHIEWDVQTAERGGHPHFMLKEILEQPRALRQTLADRIVEGLPDLPELGLSAPGASAMTCAELVACGTSWHAALVGRRYLEELARLRACAEVASEYRYRPPLALDERDARSANGLVVAISQSGETADTLAALRCATAAGAQPIAIVNVLGSSIARGAKRVLYTRAGPEISVASTKAFTTQVAGLLLLSVHLGRLRGCLSEQRARATVSALEDAPRLIEALLPRAVEQTQALAPRLAQMTSALYLGRGYSFPLALEGALKLKEITYLPAEGYPAGEMKHGPIALVGPQTAVVVLAPADGLRAKIIGNLQEVKARDGFAIVLGTEGDAELEALADVFLPLPQVDELLTPLIYAAPLQLLAYHLAVALGRDVDKPRNLAKSVTVE
jgi:glucosamine--fructose-6-phosphate aminotransferase (isomerizing)